MPIFWVTYTENHFKNSYKLVNRTKLKVKWSWPLIGKYAIMVKIPKYNFWKPCYKYLQMN